jgi:Flp pilus assembly protein TadD
MNHYDDSVNAKPVFSALILALAACATSAAWAQTAPAARPAATAAVPKPALSLDAPLFYQLLIGELELQGGRPAVALEVVLDAARRAKSDEIFERAVDIALQARAGDQALAAIKAWRASLPASATAVRYQVQVLAALGRPAEASEPVRSWLTRATPAERLAILASLPRLFVRGEAAAAGAQLIQDAASPYASDAKSDNPRTAALAAIGRGWLMAGDQRKALGFVLHALKIDPQATGALLLAVDMLPQAAELDAVVAEALVNAELDASVRLAYVAHLTQQQRLGEAVPHVQRVTQQLPTTARPWLTLGAIELELKHPQQAEVALKRYLELVAAEPDSTEDDDTVERRNDDGPVQARLMLAQAAEQRKDFAESDRQLAQITSPAHAAEVQARRAATLVRQGRWAEARDLVKASPARTVEQVRRRLMAELTVLRDARKWSEAHALLEKALKESPADLDLLYEQAMMAEKLGRMGDMEQLLRRVIELKPDHQHAYNALGYSLADRGLRLDEAKSLIQRALDLSPGDPFITDSLAWVKFRQGLHREALALLTQAYKSRPDTEIAAHLGEVLWTMGQRDEAARIWSEGRSRDAENEVLKETLKRLKPGL